MIIYILCYNEKTLKEATKRYTHSWAHPILIETQDCSFENACWKQLDKLYDTWKHEDYVGVLSHSAYKKINLHQLNQNFIHGVYTTKYVHFAGINTSVISPLSSGQIHHPHYHEIMSDLLTTFQVKGNECFFNYFMCHPEWMKKFIEWQHKIMPVIVKHPLIWTDSNYQDGKLTPKELMKLCGRPFYPHLTFILERLNGCFFQTHCDSVKIDNLIIYFLF